MTQSSNPLRQFFRQPAIYLRLPSKGQFWDPDALDMPDNQELPVFPMTAIDEITYRTPDALFNGQAVIDVIQSCVPNILNAWKTPIVDLNAVLVAIRIASYGNEMELTTTCPSCETAADFGLNLNSVLEQLRCPHYEHSLNHGDLEIQFRPMTFRQQNASNVEQFENQRMIRIIPDSDLTEDEKLQQMTQVMKNITRLTVRALTDSIASIRTPGALVTDSEHIQEFLTHCDRTVFGSIRDRAVELRADTELKPLSLKCTNCGHEYQQQISLDQANFFGDAS
jgi:hypothetical protein